MQFRRSRENALWELGIRVALAGSGSWYSQP